MRKRVKSYFESQPQSASNGLALRVPTQFMHRLRSSVVRVLFVTILLSLGDRPGSGQEDGLNGRIQLPEESPLLASDIDVENWVRTALHSWLILKSSDSLEVAGPPKRLRGWSVYAVAQSVNGIPAAHRESLLLVNPERRPVRLIGHFSAFPSPPETSPARDLAGALALARLSGDAVSNSRLVFWPTGAALTLAYEAEGSFGDGRYGFERVFVAARTGTILDRVPLTSHFLARRVFDFASACRSERIRRPMHARRATRLLGITMRRHLKRNERSAPSGDAQVDQVFVLLGKLHEFLKTVLEMDSFDDDGAPLKGVANVRYHRAAPTLPQCVGDEFNAAWAGPLETAILPVGISEFPEVLGHEFGHAIVLSGSRLIYRSESGALHEAIADSIGLGFRAWLEAGGRLEARLPDRVWKLRDPSGVSRDFQNPRRVDDLPNHYSDYRFMLDDYGGVHINSSIINQGFYLLAAGGRHPDIHTGPEVQGIGVEKALKIFGRAGFNLLTPNADFQDARYAFALAAEILYGAKSKEWVATHTAMDAIGIPGYWTRPPDPVEVGEPPVSLDEEEPSGPLPEAPSRSRPEAPGDPEPIPETEGRTEETDESEQVSDERAGAPEPAEDPPKAPSPESPPQADPAPVPKAPTSPVPPAPAHPQRPADSQPEPDPRGPIAESTRVPILVAAVVMLFLLALALLMVRSHMRGGGYDDSPNPNQVPGTNQTRIGMTSFAADSVGALEPLDGSASIPLNRDLLVSPEGLVIGRAVELCHIEIHDPAVSRRHVRCRLIRGSLSIEDLHSTGGTHVDGIPAEPFMPVEVAPGQVLKIGKRSFRLGPLIEEASA